MQALGRACAEALVAEGVEVVMCSRDRDLGCSWHTGLDAVVIIGEQLVDHPDRIGDVTALGLDETLFARVGRFRTETWSTQIVEVRRGELLDVVPARSSLGISDT